MKIRIKKNGMLFFDTYYDFSISEDCIYLACFFKKSMKYKNWIYSKNNKNTIKTEHKKSGCKIFLK